jgi:hypothetical protein
MEGNARYDQDDGLPARLVAPVAVYSHAHGCSITGGFVYRGHDLPQLRGRYVFGDFCSGTIWSMPASGAPPPGSACQPRSNCPRSEWTRAASCTRCRWRAPFSSASRWRACAVHPRPVAERCPWPHMTHRRARLASVGPCSQSPHRVTGGWPESAPMGLHERWPRSYEAAAVTQCEWSRTLLGGSVRSRRGRPGARCRCRLASWSSGRSGQSMRPPAATPRGHLGERSRA